MPVSAAIISKASVWKVFDTTLGRMAIGGNQDAISHLILPNSLPSSLTASIGKSNVVDDAVNQLQEYLEGTRKEFNVKGKLEGTPFQKSVWNVITTIPFGEVRSYSWVAEKIGSPKAVRAVGSACGKNPVAIILPCHRVVASSSLGGFGGGLELKSKLLDLEGCSKSHRIIGGSDCQNALKSRRVKRSRLEL